MKIAACFCKNDQELNHTINGMIEAMTIFPEQENQQFDVNNGTVAYIKAGERHSNIPLFAQSDQGNLLLISGVPIAHNASLETLAGNLVDQDYHTAIETLTNLDGAFAAVFWDNVNRKLLVITDFLGMQPLYMVFNDDSFLLASETKALGSSGFIKNSPDPVGWGQFFSIGHFIGNSTSLFDAKRVPAASVLLYDTRKHTLKLKQYWNWPDSKYLTSFSQISTQDIIDLLKMDVASYQSYYSDGILLLSGGFDSRLILNLMIDEKIYPKVLILDHQDENDAADSRLAVDIANFFKLDYELKTAPVSFYSSESYLDYLIMNDVATPSLYLFIAQVPAYINSEMKAVWEGCFPGYSLVPPIDPPPDNFEIFGQQKCTFRKSIRWQAVSTIFNKNFVNEMYEGFIQSFAKEQARYPNDSNGVSQFIINNRMRNRTAPNPLQVYSNKVLPFTPGINRDFWKIVATIPYELSTNFKLYFEIYKRHFPQMMQYPFASGATLYNYNRMIDRYKLKNAIRKIVPWRFQSKLGLLFTWDQSELVKKVIKDADENHPYLNPENVAKIKKMDLKADPVAGEAVIILFYWQIWRWLMEGKLNMKHRETLF